MIKKINKLLDQKQRLDSYRLFSLMILASFLEMNLKK